MKSIPICPIFIDWDRYKNKHKLFGETAACRSYPLNIRASMERPMTVRPYLYGRYILAIFWVYMKVFLTKSKNRIYNVKEYRPNIP